MTILAEERPVMVPPETTICPDTVAVADTVTAPAMVPPLMVGVVRVFWVSV